MNTTLHQTTGAGRPVPTSSARQRRAFSLIEIMVAVGLLSFIILGLVAMFSQTQRAFTTSLAQVDVLEAGRAVTDMLTRELAEMVPSHMLGTTNFIAEVDLQRFPEPLLQELPGSAHPRTNVVQRIYFLSRLNQEWTGVAYEVVPAYPSALVGTLVRYETPSVSRYFVPLLSSNYFFAHRNGIVTNRIADGIVHLRLKAVAQNGSPIFHDTGYTNAFFVTNHPGFPPRSGTADNALTDWAFSASLPDQVNYYFVSNAVPAFLELELGILDPKALERLKTVGGGDAVLQRQYLSNRVAQVHLFRQRIPIRNVDPSVYQ